MATANCKILGQKHNSNTYSESNTCYSGGSDYYVYCLKFTIPEFVGAFESLTFKLKATNSNYDTGMFRYAICTSDENWQIYRAAKNTDVTSEDDEYQVTSGVATFTGLKSSSVNGFVVKALSKSLVPGQTYYLLTWVYKDDSMPGILLTFSPSTSHAIELAFHEGLIYIDTGSDFQACQVYYDTGKEWVLCMPYADTGTDWKLCV